MENKIHFRSEKEVIGWLLGIVNTEEEYDSLISDLFRITGVSDYDIVERRSRAK